MRCLQIAVFSLVLAATVAGVLIPGSKLEPYFLLSRDWTVFALAGYGFVAAEGHRQSYSLVPILTIVAPSCTATR